MRDLHFEQMQWLALLLLLPLFIAIFTWALYRSKVAETLFQQKCRSFPWTIAEMFVFLMGCVCLIMALLKPVGFGTVVVESKENYLPAPLLLVLDTSLSMSVKDGIRDKTRLEEAAALSKRIVGQLSGLPISLARFSYHMELLSPPTFDPFYLMVLLDDLSYQPEEGGTNLLHLLQSLSQAYVQPGKVARRQIVVFTDGEDTSHTSTQAMVKEIEKLKNQGFTLHFVGLGQDEGGTIPNFSYEGKEVVSKLNRSLLYTLAKKGGGSYFEAELFSEADLAHLIAGATAQHQNTSKNQAVVQYKNLTIIPLVLAFLSFLFVFLPIPKLMRNARSITPQHFELKNKN